MKDDREHAGQVQQQKISFAHFFLLSELFMLPTTTRRVPAIGSHESNLLVNVVAASILAKLFTTIVQGNNTRDRLQTLGQRLFASWLHFHLEETQTRLSRVNT